MPEDRPVSNVLPWAIAIVVAAVVVLVVVPLVAIAMGAGPFGSDDGPTQTPVVADEETVEIAIGDFTYFPENLTVDTGTQVTFTNEDSATHDAAARNESWRTEFLGQDESETIIFDTPGTFEYYCTIHPWMEATITVR